MLRAGFRRGRRKRHARARVLPVEADDAGSTGVRDPAAASYSRESLQRRDLAGGIGGGDREARDKSCAEAFLRDALAGGRDGVADDPGSLGARGNHDDGDLPARGDGDAWAGGGESVGLKMVDGRLLKRDAEKVIGVTRLGGLHSFALAALPRARPSKPTKDRRSLGRG